MNEIAESIRRAQRDSFKRAQRWRPASAVQPYEPEPAEGTGQDETDETEAGENAG